MKVLFLTNIPSPYRVDFFNELGKLCDLTVVFERFSSSERDASWKNYKTEHFKPIMLKGLKRGVANAICLDVIKHLKKNVYDHIIVSNFTSVTGMLAISWMRMRRIPYWLESDGGFAKDGVGFKEKLKKFFVKGAKGYFSTAEEHDKYYLRYGAQSGRIHRYPFTSLYDRDILDAPVSREQKMCLRSKLGITADKVIVAVGQMIHRKGFDVLIKAVAHLPSDIACYIIGGEPIGEYTELIEAHGLNNVHFVKFLKKSELEQYFLAADVFVLPTREDIWGLVVNEAMAKGLPVVTTDRCIAGLELIHTSEAGEIVPVDDAVLLAKAIENVLNQWNSGAGNIVLERIRGYSLEKMAKRHMEVLSEETP